MIDTTEKPKIPSSREARYNNKFACYIPEIMSNFLHRQGISCLVRFSRTWSVLHLWRAKPYHCHRGTSSKATAAVCWPNSLSSSSFIHNLGSQLSGLPKTILQKAKAIFPRSRPILFRFLWLQPRTLVVLTVRLDLSWSKTRQNNDFWWHSFTRSQRLFRCKDM